MLEKRTKIFVLISLILILVFLVTPNKQTTNTSKQSNYGQAPILTVIVDVTFVPYHHEPLFEHLRNFADKNDFIILIRQVDPTGFSYIVEMLRADIHIVGTDTEPGLFEISFYYTREEHPVPLSVIDKLAVDLIGYISEIPNTEITVKRNTIEIVN